MTTLYTWIHGNEIKLSIQCTFCDIKGEILVRHFFEKINNFGANLSTVVRFKS